MSNDAPPVPAPGLTIDKSGPIRRWVDSDLQSAMDKALGQLEKDKRVAVVAVADLKGAKLAAVCRIGPAWSIMMVGERSWSGVLDGQVAVRFSI